MCLLIEKKIGKSTSDWLPLELNEVEMTHDDIYKSWCEGTFLFKEADEQKEIIGLRPPQIGGVFSALGYAKSDETGAATVVMPTGTGKTETMLSIVVAGKFKRTLVVVPSDALREQTRRKFVELGLLRSLGLISIDIANPIVVTIKHGITNDDEMNKVLKSNVIVATASSLSKFSAEYTLRLTQACSHFIVDEAHHITAKTWARVKACFQDKPIFQFTATPFRSDCSKIEGKIIFNYPLQRAQRDGYFKPIEFHPVSEFADDKADKAIADKAIELLKQDLSSGLNHIVMARVNTIKRAEKIFELYNGDDLNPVLINSKTKRKKEVLADIRNGKHKVIVCVDMLGEGFDLPQLKISAIHDPHKSIGIMLQFTGRFTRTTEGVGDAKFIANIANLDVNNSLEELYKEDSDWNSVISDISSRRINEEKAYQEFRAEFSIPSPLLNLGLTPSLSTIIYKMRLAEWKVENFHKFESPNSQIMDFIINDENTMLVFSVKSFVPVCWTSSKEFFDEKWDLYILYFDKSSNLLFIHSSAKDSFIKKLIKLVAKNAEQIHGEHVFRALSGVKRLKLQNVGLNKMKKGLRYSMHTGTEINEQIPDIEANRAIKSNIFGKGYENGKLVSIGCSYKGKIWAMDSDTIDRWLAWCKKVGSKVLDETINTNDIIKTAMQTEELDSFPIIKPLSVEWPVELLRKNELKTTIASLSWEERLIDCELLISDDQVNDPKIINIDVHTRHGRSLIVMRISKKGEVVFSSQDNLDIKFGEQRVQMASFFNDNPPVLFMADTSVINGGFRYYSNEPYAYHYDKNNVEDWDWTGVDISVESQTEKKINNSIQYHTIQKILENYDLVFDDDGAGEVADIVAIKNNQDKELIVDLYHCKYCIKKKGSSKPGARVDDVYQVAGQAGKSIKWFGNIEKLILRLMARESNRLKNSKASRIDKGEFKDLINLAKVARYSTFKLGVTIVQPAISKLEVSDDQLAIIGSTAAYIDEISGVKLRVIVNK